MIPILNLNPAPGLLLYHIQGPWQIITRPPFNDVTLDCEDVGDLALLSFLLFVYLSFFNSSLAPLFPSGYENEAYYFIPLISSYITLQMSLGMNLIYLIGYYVLVITNLKKMSWLN